MPLPTTGDTERSARVVDAARGASHVLDVGGRFAGVTSAGQVRLEVLGWSGADELPFADGSFDAVLADVDAALAPSRARLLEEAARVLRPRGVVAILDRVPTARGMILLALKDLLLGGLGDGRIGARPSCTLDGWSALARARGLELAVHEDLTPELLGRLGLVRDVVLRFEKPAARDAAVAA